ncbi:MAG: helix-turn-helix domain-containing protein [Stenotrophobium sp.]
MADRSFRQGRNLTISEIAQETGIARRVLTSIANERGYNSGVENIDKLCRYFVCGVSDVMEYIPDESVPLAEPKLGSTESPVKKRPKTSSR